MIPASLSDHAVTLIVAGIGALGATMSVVITTWITIKVKEVHQLTNSRLAKIESQLIEVTGERDLLQRTVDQPSKE
jgi:hypothetical protein